MGSKEGSLLSTGEQLNLRCVVRIHFCVAFCLLALMSSADGFFQRRDEAKSVSENSFKKLRIEKPIGRIVAPDFTLEDLARKKISLERLRGRVVFLNFCATWCLPCVVEMPSMEKLHKEFSNDGLVILAINFRETPEEVKAFVRKHKLTFTVLLDSEGSVFELYQAWALPVSTIINKRGQIVGRAMGSRDWDSKESQEFFRRLLAEKS